MTFTRNQFIIIGSCAVAALLLVGGVYLYVKNRNERYIEALDDGHFLQSLPTSPEEQFIQGQPDYHMIDAYGREVVPAGDIALRPEYGLSSGQFGFGRLSGTLAV